MRLTDRALNRALLARQGLLAPMRSPVAGVVEAIGAIQAQYWPSVAGALWARMDGFTVSDLQRALDAGELVVGSTIRRTLHVVSAREHATYAMVAEAGGANDWQRSKAELSQQAHQLRDDVLAYAAAQVRTQEELIGFIEDWVRRHPKALAAEELSIQREYRWRPFLTWSAFVRTTTDGRWTAKVPSGYRTAPCPPSSPGAPDGQTALAEVIRCHLRAFGPASADDIATWIGWKTPPVREALQRLAPELERFTDEAKRDLYDLPGAPRPDADTAAGVRFLPSFDSTLLAYAHKHRERILPAAHKDRVYVRANLQVKPTFLVDGLVAGIWAAEAKRRVATMTLTAFGKLSKKDHAAVVEQAEHLSRFLSPTAAGHEVAFAE